jgi:inorganic pyrophosphatase
MRRVLLGSLVALAACSTEPERATMNDLEHLPTWPEPGILNAIIEIPAGSAEKRQYDPATGTYPIDLRNGQPRVIRFLPYPANYGFIPSTRMNREEGGDGDAVDVFVLCGALPSGTVVQVEPIGIIELLDAGERDDKLIAIPVDPALRTVDVDDIQELPQAARDILVSWLLNYDPEDRAELVAVKDRAAAIAIVERWQLR